MKNRKYLFSTLFSTGEFAKLNGINKRTLHYYNDIGLFRPEITGENGYHYYSLMQSMQLEMILLLRKLGLSIDDIREYTASPSEESFTKILTDKKRLINQSIEQLMEAKDFLQQKLDKLDLGLIAEHGKIEKLHLPDRRILLSTPITGAYNEEDFAVLTEFSFRLKNCLVYMIISEVGLRQKISGKESFRDTILFLPMAGMMWRNMTRFARRESICVHFASADGIS